MKKTKTILWCILGLGMLVAATYASQSGLNSKVSEKPPVAVWPAVSQPAGQVKPFQTITCPTPTPTPGSE